MSRSKKKATSMKPKTNIKNSKKSVQDVQKEARDGFANLTSRLGAGPNIDNQLSKSFYQLNLLTRNRLQLEAAYRGSWIVGAMVDSIAEDMTKAGVDITSSDAAEDIEDLQGGLSRLGIWDSLCDTIKWARLYGGAIAVLMVEGQVLSTPLNIETVGLGQFQGLTVYDRWQLVPDLTTVIRSGVDIGLPAYYNILTAQDFASGDVSENDEGIITVKKGSGVGIRVHHSRVIRQIGVKLPFFQAQTEEFWGMSEIERIHDRLVSFDNATMSSASLINHANLRTVSVDSLREILSSGGPAEEGLIKMFEYMRLIQSNEGITLLDANDKFDSTSYSFAGLADMMLQFGQQLSGASRIPLVRLFGQSPAGLNSTGESDLRNYYDNINANQESKLRKGMQKIIDLTYQSMFGKKSPSDLRFKFTSLWQMSALDKATVAKSNAETITTVADSGFIKSSTALKELRQQSGETGLFTNITDSDILESEQNDEVPMPGDEEVESLNIPANDSLFKKVVNKLGKKK